MKWKFFAALMAVLGSCVATNPVDVSNAVRIGYPAAFYRDWYHEVEAEAGVRSPHRNGFDGLKFYRIDDECVRSEFFDCARAAWHKQTRTIYIISRCMGDEGVTKHEMLHDILNGDTEHRHPLFWEYSGQAKC